MDILLIVGCELRKGIFKNKLVLLFLIVYMFAGIILNLLLMKNIEIEPNEEQMFELIDNGIKIILLIKVSSILASAFLNLFEFFDLYPN